VPEIHHMVRLEMVEEVRRLLAEDPALIHARGGDGQLPLHFAQTVTMANFLIERGADINARDVDHESTAAQWMVRDRPDVARALMTRGCAADILMASALGDLAALIRILDADPAAIRTAVTPAYFPMRDPRAGGSIYTWTIGANKTAHAAAREFGHAEILRVLMKRTPEEMQLAVACQAGDEALIRQLLSARPNLASTLNPDDRRKIADAAQANNATAVRLMLEAGWPPGARGQHNATPLHWAAFHGNAGMARELLKQAAPLEVKDGEHGGTPLGWALYGSVHGWHAKTGDYAGTVEVLLAAGAEAPPVTDEMQGTPAVIEALRRHHAR